MLTSGMSAKLDVRRRCAPRARARARAERMREPGGRVEDGGVAGRRDERHGTEVDAEHGKRPVCAHAPERARTPLGLGEVPSIRAIFAPPRHGMARANGSGSEKMTMNVSLSGPVGGVAFLLLIIAFLAYASHAGAAMEREWNARLSRARRTVATVISTRRGVGAIRSGGQHAPEIVLQLLVRGRMMTARWHVFELGLARIGDGAQVAVRIDAEDPELVFPGEHWAALSFTQRYEVQKRASERARAVLGQLTGSPDSRG